MQSTAIPRSIQIRLHGYPELLVDGSVLPLQLKRGWALVACLSDPQRKVSRANAANLLWPEAERGVGRTRLRRLVHQVNAIAGLDLVAGDVDAVWMGRGLGKALSVDLIETVRTAHSLLGAPEAKIDAAPLLHPASHHILADFGLDSDVFEDWLEARRREHRQLIVRALQRLALRQLALGQAEAALAAARRLLEIDPFADLGHATVIEALCRLGQGASVETAYDACATLMRHEFGMSPSAAVEAAYSAALQRLKYHRPDSADATAGPALAASVAASVAPVAPAAPVLHYAHTDAGSVAYAVLGTARDALVMVPQAWSHIETALDEPRLRAMFERLAGRFRIVVLDRRGTGLSERIDVPHTPEAAVQDVLAVMDALELESAWLLGVSTCGAAAIEIAARHPQRTRGLILCGVNARGAWAPDYPWALNDVAMHAWIVQLQQGWGGPTSLDFFAPSVADDPAVRAWWTRTLQHSTSPNGLPALLRTLHAVDVRQRLGAVSAPTLVVQRDGDRIVRAGAARYLAERIAGAELLMAPGPDHYIWHGDSAPVLDAIEEFVRRHSGE